jgi:hypothetical protein
MKLRLPMNVLVPLLRAGPSAIRNTGEPSHLHCIRSKSQGKGHPPPTIPTIDFDYIYPS